LIGKTLAHYEILDLLGRGGMAEVYRARDTRLGRDVALKILPPEFTEDKDRLRRFESEARSASVLNHPHLAHIYDVGNDGGVFYYAMELIDGETLSQRIRRGSISLDDILRIGAQVSDALAALHERQILHRDLKPANILVDGRGDAKLVDFGLAKQGRTSSGEFDDATEIATQSGTVLGTPHYMSPEQARGAEVDARSDVFSLGVILYELATGLRPFDGESTVDVLSQLMTHEPASVSQLREDMPADLERIIRKCLSKDVSMRYASAADLNVDLRSLQSPSQPEIANTPEITTRKSAPKWIPITGALAAAAIVILVVLQLRPGSGDAIASVAVLPFTNATQSEDMAYLCDGLAEGMINSLARNEDLRVISRLSSFRFRDATADLEEIGKALGVETVIVGRLTARGDDISVSAELVDVRDSRQIWGGKFTQPNQDIVALEEQLARALAAELRPAIDPSTQAAVAHRPAQDSEAYRMFLRARELLVGTETEMLKGIDLLEQAIERQPDYALAYCALAEAHLQMVAHGIENQEQALVTAKSALNSALEIDPDIAEAHSLLGSIAWSYDWDWGGSMRHHERALALDPNSLTANLRYSECLTMAGRWEEAVDVGWKAKAIDPLSTRATHWVGFALLGNRQFELAAEEFRYAVDLNPHWIWGYVKLSRALASAGRFEEALDAAQKGDRMFAGDETPLARAWLGATYSMVGADSLAQDSLEQLLAMEGDDVSVESGLQDFYLALGRTDEALSLMESAYENRYESAAWFLALPGLYKPELAEIPRYQRIIRLMGLEDPS
jgi:serine/threonine protein kinase/tetratricopeptide (TPR) repeat protein